MPATARSAPGPRWEGARNLADLGGLPLVSGGRTASGRVYRSAAPEWMTEAGWAEARAAGLTTVIDLRNDMERGRNEAHPVIGPAAMAGITVVSSPTEDPEDQSFLAECGPWLDHPQSWDGNLEMFPDRIAAVISAIATARPRVLLHCAGGRDRTGMIGSILLRLAGATHQSLVANYESGFRGAARHRGHGWSFDPTTGQWVPPCEESWSDEELEEAIADRRPVLEEWARSFDAEGYLLDAGMETETLQAAQRLLI